MKQRKLWFAIVALCGILLPLCAAEKEPSMQEFMQLARRKNQFATYARLQGMLQHRRRGKAVVTMPVYFGVILHPDRTIGQLVLDKSEGYMLGQAVNSGLTSVTPMPGKKSDKLGYVGLRASDLTLSFLFCKPEKEFAEENVGGVVPCRVIQLDDPAHKEKIKVWIAREHCFPLQAEFFRYGEKESYRVLEASGFTKKNELYYVRKLRVEGPGWRTKIDFDSNSADVGKVDMTKPPRIVIKLKEK
ncbi:MAG: hypothetical protein J6R86_00905 [Lentisphaeria bacterium]|nr:hypothetical protein [Lentisphaeria bacterium]